MSYGRTPFYIYESGDGFTFHQPEKPAINIPYDAIAQLIATMAWRDNGELEAMIERGYAIRPDLQPRQEAQP
jgi:hypothetical protein